jgi:hypothetical protein
MILLYKDISMEKRGGIGEMEKGDQGFEGNEEYTHQKCFSFLIQCN